MHTFDFAIPPPAFTVSAAPKPWGGKASGDQNFKLTLEGGWQTQRERKRRIGIQTSSNLPSKQTYLISTHPQSFLFTLIPLVINSFSAIVVDLFDLNLMQIIEHFPADIKKTCRHNSLTSPQEWAEFPSSRGAAECRRYSLGLEWDSSCGLGSWSTALCLHFQKSRVMGCGDHRSQCMKAHVKLFHACWRVASHWGNGAEKRWQSGLTDSCVPATLGYEEEKCSANQPFHLLQTQRWISENTRAKSGKQCGQPPRWREAYGSFRDNPAIHLFFCAYDIAEILEFFSPLLPF